MLWNTTTRAAGLLPSVGGTFIFRDPQMLCLLSVLHWIHPMATLKILLRSPLQDTWGFCLFVWWFFLSVGLTTFLCLLWSCTEEPSVLGKQLELPLGTNSAVRENEFLVLPTHGEVPANARYQVLGSKWKLKPRALGLLGCRNLVVLLCTAGLARSVGFELFSLVH